MDMLEEETFQKVRRNLVGVSVLVIADKVGNLKFCTIDLLGNNFVIANQSIIPLLLGIATSYCLLRYFTSFNSISGWTKVMDKYAHILQERLKKKLEREYWRDGGVGVQCPKKSWYLWEYTLFFSGNDRKDIAVGLGRLMIS